MPTALITGAELNAEVDRDSGKGSPPDAEREQATVQQANQEQHGGEQPRRPRHAVRVMVALKHLCEQHSGGEDVNPVDAVMRVERRRGVGRTPRLAQGQRHAHHQQQAAPDFHDGQQQRGAVRFLAERADACGPEDDSGRSVLDLLNENGALAPLR